MQCMASIDRIKQRVGFLLGVWSTIPFTKKQILQPPPPNKKRKKEEDRFGNTETESKIQILDAVKTKL